MNHGNRDKFKIVVKNIGYVDQLTTEQLVEISCKLFEHILFCDCEVDNSYEIVHKCDRFYHHDHEHSPTCKCCQQMMLLYYLGRCMEKLADDGRLPQFDEAHLSSAKIRDRTYGHLRIGTELIFRIDRHLYAWTEEAKMEVGIQTWVFDFAQLSLANLSYDVIPIGILVRELMESRSEWKGTSAELLAELKEATKRLKINTKYYLWPKSSYKFNQTLRELETYFEEFGITLEKGRNARIIKISKPIK
jgi:hypothetical protein